MDRKTRRLLSRLPKRFGAGVLSAAMILNGAYTGSMPVLAAETTDSWKQDVLTALDNLSEAQNGKDQFTQATENLQNAYDSLVGAKSVENLAVIAVTEDTITLEWSTFESEDLVGYNVYWADADSETAKYQLLDKDSNNLYDESGITINAADLDAAAPTVTFVVQMSTNKNHWFKVAPVTSVGAGSKSDAVMSPTAVAYETQLENINRGLTVTVTGGGAYLNWRLLGDELDGGYTETGLTGYDFNIYRDGEKIATVTDSTNYLDTGFSGELTDSTYKLVPVKGEVELTAKTCSAYDIFTADASNTNVAYIDIPLQKPADTTFRETYGIDTMVLSGYNWAGDGYGATNVDSTITYSANDMSVADVDGDGEYEYIVKWDPSYSKDVSRQGYTGKQYIDCYELDGTLLWRLDLGVNIRAGAHYTEFGVYDFDGDGKAEMMVKTAPGSKMIKYAIGEDGKNIMENGSPKVASEDYVNISAEDAAAGVTNDSNYVFSAADYRNYLIEIFQDWGKWSRYSEKTVKDAIEGHWSNNLVDMFTTDTRWRDSDFYTGEADGSKNKVLALGSMSEADIQSYVPGYKKGDKLVNITLYNGNDVNYLGTSGRAHALMKTVRVADVKDYYGGYDLSSVDKDVTGVGYTKEEATILADYFLNHYQYRMDKHSLTVYEGYVITGPEYITLFDCSNGDELDTQDWYYEREDDGMLWGDYAMDFMEPGNRCDRFNVVVAYLDGETPSCVMGRGYYTRTTMVAYNVVDKKLAVAGSIDSGWTVMTNPFNDGPHGYDGCDPVNGTLSGQGDHYIAVADVDGNGRQEIVNGGAIVDYKDGNLHLYSSGGDYNANDPSKGWLKYGHGDAIHITDIDPDHPGLEIVSCFEGAAWAPYNWALRDAKSNTVLFGEPGASDFGRVMIGDVLPDVPGLEISTNYDAKGNRTTSLGMGTNMNIKWAADMTTQFVNGSRDQDITITGGVNGANKFLTAVGYRTNNDTKGNPGLVADLFGDSREEIILRRADSSSLRIFMNTEVSNHKNYTLMHNAQYRVGIASQNSSYNQPAYTDYYYASDTDWSRVLRPNMSSDQEPGPVVSKPANVTLNVTTKTMVAGDTLQLIATVIPSSADQTVTWSTSDEKVATVDENGVVTAVGRGVARITATTINEKECTCTVNVMGGYNQDGLDQMPIGTTLDFIFGSDAVSTEQKTAVKAGTVYSDETGYGFAAPSNITLTDGKDYVAGNNYRSGDAIPVYEYPTFQVKVPVGVYEVTIIQGTNGTDDAVNGAYVEGNKYSVRWSSQAFATSYTEPTADSWIYTKAGEVKTSTVETAVADGQLTINLATSLTNEGESGTTYIKEIIVTRKEQITDPSEAPTLRFIGDSTLAKYPPEDGGTWTPIPERTGWGEDFSMGRFVDESVQLVNKAVAGSSVKSYIYDGYLNDFLLNSHPGDTVIIEGGINDSAAGPRFSTAEEFKATMAYVIDCCEAFGLDVILSAGTSSATTYTEPMQALAQERELHYVDLLNLWTAYQSATGKKQGDMTVDGTHLKRVGAIVAAQLVANDIADLEGLYISGLVKKTAVNYEAPTAVATGLYAKAQTENSLTLAWNMEETTLYDPTQLITDFNVYSIGSDGKAVKVATQTAYISAGMEGPQMQTTFAAEGAGNYYVTSVGLTGEGPVSATLKVGAFTPDDSYTLSKLIETFGKQLHDATPYTVKSYAAVMTALAEGSKTLADTTATADDIKNVLDKAQAAIAALQLNAVEFIKEDFQKEPLGTAPWGVSGSHKTLMSAEMEEDGNRLLNLYVEAAGGRSVDKVFANAESAALEMVEFEWYPGNPDQRNVTEVEFLSSDTQRVLSLKSSSNGHIGYVVGNYDTSNNNYKIGDGFHAYEGSTAKDLGLTNEAWYNVKIVFNFSNHTADLYIVPRDDASLESAVIKDIAIDQASNTITKMNFRLERGRTDGDAGNDLSILWDMYMDDYGIYYGKTLNNVNTAEYEAAKAAYLEKVKGLSSEVLSGELFVLAQAVMDIMSQDVGFFTAEDYQYAVEVLKDAEKNAPSLVPATSVKVTAEAESITAGLTTAATAELSKGANEEILWSSSDESIAKVEGTGTKAVVTALKAGTVTITAKGATSGVSGSVELTVTGEAFFFNSDTAANGAYSAEIGYGFKDYTYPEPAKGWTAGISPDGNAYVARELFETDSVSYLKSSESGADYVAVYGQNWTEMPDGGRDEDKVPYQNTSAFVVDRANGNYTVSATFYNPGQSAVDVQVIAEDIVRYAAGNHATAELASASVGAGQSATVSFNLALTDGQMTLRFVRNTADDSYELAANRGVYVKSVSVDEYRTDDREKTAVLIAGDSTVQSYLDKSYRTSWAQLLYSYFGNAVKDGVNDGNNEGYATYETEDTYLVNYARDARSTKSFLEEGRLNELLLNVQEGDYVLMQFAHNDDNQNRSNRFVSIADFKENIKAYDAAIKERGGTLVLVTPIALGVWDEAGTLDHRFDDYRLAMMQSGLPVIDLMGSTLELLASIGPDNEKTIGIYKDTVHTLESGAVMYARMMSSLLLNSEDERIAPLQALMDAETAGCIRLAAETEDAIFIGTESYVAATLGKTVADGPIIFLSSDDEIVKVDDKGILTAGNKPGVAIITAGYRTGDPATTDATAYSAYVLVEVTNVKVETDVPISGSKEEIANAVLTPEEKENAEKNGDIIEITLKKDEVDEENVDAPIKEKVVEKIAELGEKLSAALGLTVDLRPGTYLNIYMQLTVGGKEKPVPEPLYSPIRLTITIPEKDRLTEEEKETKERFYQLIRVHGEGENAVAEVLDDVDYNEDTYEMTFDTDKFSYYVLAYYDQEKGSEPTPPGPSDEPTPGPGEPTPGPGEPTPGPGEEPTDEPDEPTSAPDGDDGDDDDSSDDGDDDYVKSPTTYDERIAIDVDNVDMDGMMAQPMEGYMFDFGNKNGTAEGYVGITTQAYDAEAGYGWTSNTASGINAGGVGVTVQDTEADAALSAAASDLLYVADGGLLEFAIDLPAGTYKLDILAAAGYRNNAYNNNKVAVNGVDLGVSGSVSEVGNNGNNAFVNGIANAFKSCKLTLDEPGQVVIASQNEGQRSIMNAILVSEYVERTDDFDADAWALANEKASMLKMKAGFFADDSTTMDYDVILVNRMTETMDALEAVMYMASIADTTEGDALYVKCEEAIDHKTLYTESSIANLEAAMAEYQTAKGALDIRTVVRDTYDVIEFWLKGVTTEYDEQPYAGYFDFNTTQTGGNKFDDQLVWEAPGWTPVGITEGHPELTLYTAELGYGLTAPSGGRHRGTGDPVMDDIMMGGTFQVDLPAGDYRVITYTGDLMDGCKGNSIYDFYTGYVDADNPGTQIASLPKETSAVASILERKVKFKLDEATKVTMVVGGYSNAVVFEQYIPAKVEGFSVEDLKNLKDTIDAQNLVETDYTISTWTAFKEAYDKAAAAIDRGQLSVQEGETLKVNLQTTYEALEKRVATGQLFLDFGPAQESETVPGQVADNILLSGFVPSDVNLDSAKNLLSTGADLYADNMDDNGIHYGFTSEVSDGFTASGGAYFRDYVFSPGGAEYTFKADVPVGQYMVYVYTGCKEANNLTKFFFNEGEAAAASTNEAVTVPTEGTYAGKTIYTQTSNSGGQFAAPTCIYTVNVTENKDALSEITGVTMGTLSLTLFNDECTVETEETARFNGIALARIGDAGEVKPPEEVNRDQYDPEAWTFGDVVKKFDFGNKTSADGFTVVTDGAYSAETGYGYTSTNEVAYNRVGVKCEDTGDNIDQNLVTACCDLARASNELTFAVDMPAGSYLVQAYSGSGDANSAYITNKIFINGTEIGKVTAGTTTADLRFSTVVTLNEAGQIVVSAQNEGQLAILNALVITAATPKGALKAPKPPVATQNPGAPTTTHPPVATETPVVTEAPVETQTPATTEAPTETPIATDEPAATDEPVSTDEPAVTEEAATDEPAATEEAAETEESGVADVTE